MAREKKHNYSKKSNCFLGLLQYLEVCLDTLISVQSILLYIKHQNGCEIKGRRFSAVQTYMCYVLNFWHLPLYINIYFILLEDSDQGGSLVGGFEVALLLL